MEKYINCILIHKVYLNIWISQLEIFLLGCGGGQVVSMRQSEFESRWSIQFFSEHFVFEKNETKTKRGRGRSINKEEIILRFIRTSFALPVPVEWSPFKKLNQKYFRKSWSFLDNKNPSSLT